VAVGRLNTNTLSRTQSKVNSGISNLRESRASARGGASNAANSEKNQALTAEIEELERNVKVTLGSGDGR